MMMTQAAPKSAGGGTGVPRAARPPLVPFAHPWSAGAVSGLDQASFQVGHNLLANSLTARLRLSSGTRTAVSASSPAARKGGRAPLARSNKGTPGEAAQPLVEQEAVKRKDYTRQWAQNLQEPTNVLPVTLPSDTLPRLNESSCSDKTPHGARAMQTLYLADGSFTSNPLSPIVGLSSPENRNYIKMVKRSGVFQPLDKYATPRPRGKGHHRVMSARDSEYELLPFPFPDEDDEDAEDGQGDRKRKGLKVSWSQPGAMAKFPGLARNCSAYSGTTETTDKRSSSASQRPHFVTRKQKIVGVGVKWKLPLGYDNQHMQQKRIRSGNVSRDLHPVTSAMEREGTSVSKTRWQVASSMGSVDTSASWLDKLESIKRSPSLYKDATSRSGISGSHHHDDVSTAVKSPGEVTAANTRRSRVGSCS